MMFKNLQELSKIKECNNLRKFTKVILIVVIIAIIVPFNIVKASEYKGELLIIYDDYKEYGEDSNNLNNVIKASLTTGKSIELRKSNSYNKADLNSSQGIIVLSNREGSFDKSQVDELYLNNEKLLWIGKNSSKPGVVPLGFKHKLDILKMNKIIYDKFVKEEDRQTDTYLVLDEVYPYDDLNMIIEKADYLYDLGIPFLVTAMEVYNNLEFDSMKRYAETLRYCKSKGGTIILGDPYLYNKGPTEEELIENLGIAQDGFINYQVYPIGLTINDYYLYREDRVKYLENTSTIIINENENLGLIDFEEFSIKAFDNGLIKITGDALDLLNVDELVNINELLNNVVIGLDGSLPINEFKEKVELYKRYNIEFSDPKNLEGELVFGSNKINNTKDGVMVNGVNFEGNRFVANEELELNNNELGVKEEELNDENISLKEVNKVIFVITIIGIIIFIIFFLYSLKIDRRKYFK